MSMSSKRYLLLLGFLLFVLAPLIILFIFPTPPGRSFWRDFSVALGFVGLSLAGLQFLPTTRLDAVSNVFHMDQIYATHHLLSVLSVLLIFLHPMILFVDNPLTIQLLNIFNAPFRAQAGILGLLGLLIIAITSVLRKQLHLDYDKWHWGHDFLAIGIAVFSLIHIFKVNYYTRMPAMTIWWILQAILWTGLTLYMRVLKPLKLLKKPYEIKEVRKENADIYTLSLSPRGFNVPDFHAGQIAWLSIRTSPFSISKNPFSISSSVENKERLEFTIKELGDLTSTIKDLTIGETVYVEGPFGSFNIREKGINGMVLLVGGIGVAPALSIIRTMADANDQRPVYLFYADQNPSRLVCREELEMLDRKMPNFHLIYVFEDRRDHSDAYHGFITTDILDKELPMERKHYHYFICGPLPMIEAMENHLMALHIPDGHVQSERYEMA